MRFRNFLCLALLFGLAISQTLKDAKDATERRVREIAEALTEAYENRCTEDTLTCVVKAYNGCEGTSKRECFDDFVKYDGCFDGGASLGREPAMTFPPNKDP